MRITLLIVLIITTLSKNFVNIYETEKQIQKETLKKCILNSNKLIKDMKEIYGDIRKAFINHNNLEILKRLGDFNPRNNKILFQCFNTLLDEEDDILLEKGPSSYSGGRSSPSRSSPSRSSPTKTNPTKINPTKTNPTKTNPTKINPPKSNPTKTNPTKVNPPKSNPTKTNPTKVNPPKSNPTKTNPTKTNPTKKNPTKVNPTKTNPPKSNPTKTNPPKSNPTKTNPPKSNPTKKNPTKTNPPKTNPTKTNPTKTNPTKTNPPKSNPTKTNPPKSNPTKTNPPKTNPPKSNPPKSNPTKTNPTKTNPTKTNPPKSNPTKTNPTKKNPTKTNPPKTNPTKAHVNKISQKQNNKNKGLQWAKNYSKGPKKLNVELKQKKKDKENSASFEVERQKGRTDVSVKVGGTKTGKDGTKKGQEYGASVGIINDGRRKGVEASVSRTQTEGDHTKEDQLTGSYIRDRSGNTKIAAGYRHSDTVTHEKSFGPASVSQTQKSSTDLGLRVDTKKGKATFEGSHSEGTQYSVSAKISDNLNAEASAGKTQTRSGKVTIDRHGFGVKLSDETAYNAKAHIQAGKTSVDASGTASDKTYGGFSIKGKKGQVNIDAKIGKKLSAKGEIKVNGKTVASAEGSVKGEAKAGIQIDKKKITAQAGVNAQANAKVTFGHTEVKVDFKFDFHIKITFDFKTGLHFDIGGGISFGITIKDTNEGKDKNLKSSGQPGYILYRKRRIGKKNMKKSQKNKILGQTCRPSRHRA